LPLEPASDPSDHTEARQETFAVGSTIANGAYRIDGILNASASSTRYVAIDVRHGRAVTVTALRPAVAAGATALLQQIRIAAGLQHPHIVPVFDSGEADGRVFYVTPRVAGDSLRVFLKRNPFIRLRSVLRTARDVADALASAHMHGVVHGAVSPESVFMTGDPVTDDLHAMVADFGVATALDAARRERSAPDSADTRGPADTNVYLAPELLDGSAVSIRADVFAWGAITRELLWCHHASNNRQPANGATPGASTPLDSSVPSSIAELVRQCLHRDPEARPADAKELLSRFDHAVSLTRRISPPTPGILARLTRFAGGAHHGHPAHASVFTRKRRVAEALIVVLALLLSRRAAPAERVQTVSVVVAASDIVDGVRLDQSTMAIAHWPRQAKPFAAFASLDSVLGRVTSLPVAKGEAIVPDRLVTPGAGTPDSKIDAGKRAHPVLISDPGASVGRIPPYGRVDVMSVRRGVDARRVMTVVFSDIRLLEIKGVSRRRGTDGTFTATAVARLELSPAEIARLRGAAAQGEIRLSPREQTDSTRRAPGKEP
jgi:Flp pilus assembly protein CpaB